VFKKKLELFSYLVTELFAVENVQLCAYWFKTKAWDPYLI
jgi:hypothetical protein